MCSKVGPKLNKIDLKLVQNLLGHPVELGFFESRFWHSKSGIVVNNLFPNKIPLLSAINLIKI